MDKKQNAPIFEETLFQSYIQHVYVLSNLKAFPFNMLRVSDLCVVSREDQGETESIQSRVDSSHCSPHVILHWTRTGENKAEWAGKREMRIPDVKQSVPSQSATYSRL